MYLNTVFKYNVFKYCPALYFIALTKIGSFFIRDDIFFFLIAVISTFLSSTSNQEIRSL